MLEILAIWLTLARFRGRPLDDDAQARLLAADEAERQWEKGQMEVAR